ncbi:MAG: hypothetical protein ACRDHZ_17935 [Ktedonobacteraceae bacterium]
MRCPYCGGLNRDQSTYCVNCGRTMQGAPPQYQQQPQGAPQAKWSGTQPQARPVSAPPPPARPQQNYTPAQQRPSRQPVPPPQAPVPVAAPANRRNPPAATAQVPVQAPIPPAPAPFPPQTSEQFEALLATGAQQYTVTESVKGDGKKKYVRIVYADCTHWQQAATLLKALREQFADQFETIIIQGFTIQQPNTATFNQGQLQFDRHVYLGSRVSQRYIVETSDGFKNDSVRFVLYV